MLVRSDQHVLNVRKFPGFLFNLGQDGHFATTQLEKYINVVYIVSGSQYPPAEMK